MTKNTVIANNILGNVSKDLTLRYHCGQFTNEETGEVFEFGYAVPSGSPFIYCPKNGNIWKVDWTTLLDKAREAGLDK